MNEQQRLLSMLNEQKISKNDFDLLSAALDKKPTRLMTALYFLVNPFQKIAGIKSLLIGIAITLLISYFGYHTQQYYVNAMQTADVSTNLHPRVAYTFWLVLYQNVISCLILSLCYLICAQIFRAKGVRITDFFGMVGVARLRFLMNAFFILAVQHFSPDFLHARDVQLQYSWLEIIFSFQNTVLAIWQLVIYFNALKVASGLTGSKLWISAIASFVAASAIGSELTMFFV